MAQVLNDSRINITNEFARVLQTRLYKQVSSSLLSDASLFWYRQRVRYVHARKRRDVDAFGSWGASAEIPVGTLYRDLQDV